MLTLFHSPQSRSTALMVLLDEMGIEDRVKVETVSIARIDGTGHADSRNPHPEGKVPVLRDGDTLITERGAIILYLTDLFPDSRLAPQHGDTRRGAYLTWLLWYHSTMEPVIINAYAGLTHPALQATFRGPAEMAARLRAALDHGPWLLGDSFSAADLLCHSPFAWFPQATPDDPLIHDWVKRCMDRPSVKRVSAAEADRRARL